MSTRLTRITATRPSIVSKVFTLVNDKLHKGTTADVYAGTVDLVEVDSLTAFGDVLVGLTHSQCMVYGIPPKDHLVLVTEKAWAQAGRPDHQVARTKEAFRWNSGAGVLMLDYDPSADSTPLARDSLISAVRTVCPALATAQMLWWTSASSNIFNADTDEELRGIRGQRLYLMVADAADIPRAGKALCEHLWAAGHGHFEVSKSGSLLERSLFDTSVWQSNRLDFAGGSKCNAPLVQKRGVPLLIDGPDKVVDSVSAIPEPDAQTLQAATENKASERHMKQDEAAAQRELWTSHRVEELVQAIVKKTGAPVQQSREQATTHVQRVLTRSELFADWMLTVKPGDSSQAVVISVAEVLDNPYRWHNSVTLDPVEPDYDGGRWVGKLFLIGARPGLYSFAHGGHRYRLLRQLHRIEIVRGKLAETVDSLVEVLRRSPDMYDYGTEMASPAGGGELLRLEKDNLRYMAAGITQFWKWHKLPDGNQVEVLENPPVDVAASVLALRGRRGLKVLDAVISAPLMRLDGSLFMQPGYDTQTRLLLDMTEPTQDIPTDPTPDQLQAAFNRLWEPFAEFPFVGPVDCAVLLASLLTAIVRPVLGTAPGFAFDATQHGTGKTILAECAAVLATGKRPITWPHVGNNEEETRKRLLTVLRSGQRVLLWDNIVGQFDSPSLGVLLTSDIYTDRILGITGSEAYPNRLLTIFTGNNFTPTGELPRRVLTCRLDAQSERPYTRTFRFNPTDLCLANRQALIAAGLTLLCGFVAAGRPKTAPALGSFGQWDGLVRQAALWIARHVAPTGLLGDPVQSILAHADTDPVDEAHFALKQAWLHCYGEKAVSSRDLLTTYNSARRLNGCPTAHETQLADALDEFKTGHELTAKSVGRVLVFRRDRIVGGLRIVRGVKDRTGTYVWRVRRVLDVSGSNAGFAGFAGFGSTRSNFNSDPTAPIDGGKVPMQNSLNPAVADSVNEDETVVESL